MNSSVDIYQVNGTTQDSVIEALVPLHQEAFPGFFLTSLKGAFLRLLYRGFIAHSQGICLVADEQSRVVGFAAGTMNPDGFFSALLRRQAFRFALAAIPGLLRNPCFAFRKCLGALFYRGESPGGIPDAALLSSLAVSPTTQNKGIGQALVRAFAEEVRRRGGKAVYLTTDESDNEKANRFYAKCGFELLDTFKRPGNRVMNRWVMRLA